MTPTPTTRPSLLLRLRDAQDHAAWGEFVSIYESVVLRLLRKSGLQDADCRELMQEVFLTVSLNVDRWDPDKERGSFRGWLRRVTRNLVINWLKRQQRTVVGGSDLHALLAEVSTDSEAESREFDLEVRRAVFRRASEMVRSEVSSQSWQAFWAVAVSQTSVGEAAIRLGMTAGAVRVARCRIIARLREVVAEMEKGT